MRMLIVALPLTAVWLAITGSVTPLNIGFGLVLSLAVAGLLREQIGRAAEQLRVRPLALLSLIALFFVELAKSAWRVTVIVLSPGLDIKPGILAFPLTLEREAQITLLANLITLTPGTLSVDVSDDRKYLYVHALDCRDPDAIRRDIADGFERKIKEAFR
ncbi:Na+/H+ antiporter subunit E [Allorhizobium taibaishanense]|uniref:Multicomponent Na+:H+ antiporter subunit E n=1 Tax=Allorhizobium taibaishanense TaxID=887144 RepID=A0A1Q8ZZI5_9HYPH|nr:Na+/H+ antiporter subunit E [Allorhizobium taibaishanense]MBB4007256.1 multicomponent Na+:H+ antiporter subunit E [Allorhizobium taibaishanense]OLP47745.1 Na+/H+ antiporter subunit E [Allorhizobium taibaishanense]